MGNFWESFGNFFTGKGWRDNSSVAEEEERRRRAAQQQQAPAPVSRSQAPTVPVALGRSDLSKPLVVAPSITGQSGPVQPTLAEPPKEVKPREGRNLFESFNDLASGFNERLLGGIARGGASLLNNLVTGFNQDEATRRTDEFMRRAGLDDGQGGGSALSRATNTNRDSDAFRIGQATGSTAKLVTDVAPMIGAAGAAQRGVAGVNALQNAPRALQVAAPHITGSLAATGVGAVQDVANENQADLVKNALIGTGIDLTIPAVGRVLRPFVQQARQITVPMRQEASQALQVANRPTRQLGDMGDGTISPNRAQATRQNAIARAEDINRQADELEQAAMQADQRVVQQVEAPVVADNIANSPTVRELEELFPAETGAPIARQLDDSRRVIDEQAAAAVPEQQIARQADEVVTPIETPTQAQSRAIVENTAPVVPEQALPTQASPADAVTAARNRVAELRAQGADELTISQAVEDLRRLEAGSAPTPQVQQAYREFEEAVAPLRTDDELAAFAEKNYRARQGEEVTYTPAERQVLENLRGLTDENIQLIDRAFGEAIPTGTIGRRADYVASAKKDTVQVPTSREEALSSELDFAKGSSGGLEKNKANFSRENVREAYARERATALYSKDFTPEELVRARSTRANKEIDDLFSDETGHINRTEAEVNAHRQATEALEKKRVDNLLEQEAYAKNFESMTPKQRKVAEQKLVKSNDELDEMTIKRNAKVLSDFDAIAKREYKAINEQIKKLGKNGNQAKLRELQQQRVAIAEKYNRVHGQAHYMQGMPQVNTLFQPRGRIADAIQNLQETITSAPTTAIGQRAMNRVYSKATGEDLFGNMKDARSIYKDLRKEGVIRTKARQNYLFNREYTSQTSNPLLRGIRRLKTESSRATELAARNRRALIETVSVFVARGERAGLTGDALKSYVRSQVGKADWKATESMLWNMNNRHTGVAASGRQGADVVEKFLTGVSSNTRSYISKNMGSLPLPVQRAIGNTLDVVVGGFSRAAYRVTKHAAQRSILGVDSLVRARLAKDPLDQAMYLRQAITDASVGATFAVGGASVGIALAADGRLVGGYPEDPAERRRWEKEGITPYSIKLGDKWVNFARYMPTAFIPVMAGGLLSQGRAEDVPNLGLEVLKGAYENTGVGGVANVMATGLSTLSGKADPKDIERIIASTINVLNPVSGLQSTIGRATDDSDRSVEGDNFFDNIIKQVQKQSMFRGGLDEKTDAFGDPIKNDRWSSLFYVKSGSEDTPVTAELSRLAEAGVEAFPKNTQGENRNYTLKGADGLKIDLPQSKQNDLNNAIKRDKSKQAELMMSTDEYKKASDERKAELLRSAYSLDSSHVAAKWASDNGIEGVKSRDTNINDNISTEGKKALMTYQTIGDGDAKKKWLENPKNASDYWNAQYDNKAANGTLTEDDKSLRSMNNLAYKALAAKVNYQVKADPATIQAYSEYTYKQWAALADDNPLKAKLWALDQARAKAGVSGRSDDKNMQKYVKAGGTGGRGSTKFSIPSIASGSGGGSTESQKYIAISPLRNSPIPKVAKATPKKRRSISVSRGVKL